jgi:preprotein translocase subunit SecE
MARLLRKKAPSLKKKKNPDLGTNSDSLRGDQKSGSSIMPPVLSKSPGVKSSSPSKLIPAVNKKEPGKIATYWNKAAQFLREVKIELKKVAWPSRKQTIGSTIVVLVMVLLISFFLGAVDVGLAGIVRVVLQ